MPLLLKAENDPLRVALDFDGQVDVSGHKAAIDGVSRTHPHSIRFVEQPQVGACVAFALGLTTEQIYRDFEGDLLIRLKPSRFDGRSFVDSLLLSHLCELSSAKPDCLVLYFRDSEWRHAGVLTSLGRVTSKWGEFPVYEHGIDEVPRGYGDQVRFYKPLEAAVALELVVDHAAELVAAAASGRVTGRA